MKVDIKREEDVRGMLKKKTHHKVSVRVDFSEEEKATIKKCGVEDMILLSRDLASTLRDNDTSVELHQQDPSRNALRVGHLIDPKDEDHFLSNLINADDYIAEVKGALAVLKTLLDKNKQATSSWEESYEL